MSISILVVDDEPALINIISILLTDEGYVVHIARDGFEAWQKIQQAPPDVLITDIRMPRLNGHGLIQLVRLNGHRFPVVAISAHAAKVNLPGVHHPAKPFDIDVLLATIERLAAENR